MKKLVANTFFRVFLALIGMFVIYYFVFIRPEVAVPRLLGEYDQILTENNQALLQSRLALLGITQLSVDSIDLSYELENSVVMLKESQEKGSHLAMKSDEVPAVRFGTSELIRSVQNNLSSIIPDLLNRTSAYYQSETILINNLELYRLVVQKILEYDPLIDLGSLSIADEKEQFIARADAAVEGLRNIQKDLDSLDSESLSVKKEVVRLNEQIDLVVGNYQILIANLKNNQVERFQQSIDDVYQTYGSLKEQTLDVVKAMLQTESSVGMISEMTNLLYEYEFLLGQIDILRSEVVK